MKNYQQTPKQRRIQKRKVEKAKQRVAQSTPLFNPRESFTSRKKVGGGVPVGTLNDKQHIPNETASRYRWW